jgi:hypothetical protein
MKIEAEGSEIVMQNSNGDTIVIPKVHRQKALKYIEEGNYKAIDDLAESLPFMEDYADDGSLVVNKKPTEPVEPEPKNQTKYQVTSEIPEDYGFGNITEMQKRTADWRSSYGTDIKGEQIKNPPKFISSVKDAYGRYKQAPNPYGYRNWETGEDVPGQNCLGSACRASKQFNPSLPTTYDVLERQLGIYQESTEGEGGLPSMDSWEVHQKLEDTGEGTILFNKDLKSKDREEYIEKFDPSQLPLGTVFGHGDAKEAGYVAPTAKSYRGKNEPLPRHSSTLVKYDESTGDMLIYDYGQIKRVAYNRELTPEEIKKNATKKDWEDPDVYTWKDYAKRENLVYATKINKAGDYTYKKLKEYKEAKGEKAPTPIQPKKPNLKK